MDQKAVSFDSNDIGVHSNLFIRHEARNIRQSQQRRESETVVFDDGTTSYFWRAHTITVLLVGILTLIYVVFLEEQKKDLEYNTKRGVVACILTFLAFGITQAKDGPFIRPHPAWWRLMLCISVLYELGLVFLLFQTVFDARRLMTYLDTNLNQPLDFRHYGGACCIWDPGHPDGAFHNVVDKMDLFVFAHFFGWFAKTIMLRDVWIANVISFVFELLEYTFEHQLPNFSECWWDHWILDFLICNGLGIYFGLKYLRYLAMKEYKWNGLWNIHSYKGKVRRVVGQFSPYSWVKFQWKPTENLFRWLFVSLLTFMFLLAELNTFYLKFVLWIPPDHPFVSIRLVLFVFWGAVAVREAYDYAGGISKHLGQQAWVLCAIITTELLIVFRFGSDVLSTPFPSYIKWFWISMFSFYILWSLWKFQMKFPRFRKWLKFYFHEKLGEEHNVIKESASDLSNTSSGCSDLDITKAFRRRPSPTADAITTSETSDEDKKK